MGFIVRMKKRARISKKKFCCFLPYFYKYIYLNSIFVYYALQLHLRESKPNLCITLSKILRCSWWLSSTVTRSKADALHLCQWLRLNRTFGWSMVHHPNNKAPNQTKLQLILSIYCLYLLLFSFNFFLIARMCVWPTTCVGLKKKIAQWAYVIIAIEAR